MDRLQRAAVILSLIESLRNKGSWCGETHVQKAVFFLQFMLGVPLEYRFILYKHGPFSFDLRDEITEMRVDGFLKLEPQPYPYGPSLVPDKGSDLLKQIVGRFSEQYAEQLGFVARELGEKGVTELERLGTALYLAEVKKVTGSVEGRAQVMIELKPHITLDFALSAVAEVDRMKRSAAGLTVEGAA
ncbi:MAG: hypothetical protein HY675_27615 [Chloroflexi bacterium]|nr:hypothetical protein [Chloroflexota bacterium]